MSLYQNYLNAEYQINEGLIRLDLSLERPEGYIKTPQGRMDEMRSFLAACGNPQAGVPAVHVAGTSGKGSVCAAIAGILTQAGLKVGLHVSPYLQSATEKIWISDQFVSTYEFENLVNWVMPIAKPKVLPQTRASIHGMASISIAFEAFKQNNVDVMVFEAGCGARYDLTSFVDTKVAVVTNIGLDHIVSLGPDIENIAWHKAGVARKNAPLITGAEGKSLDVIKKEADLVGCEIKTIPKIVDPRHHNQLIATEAAIQMGKYLNIPICKATIEKGLQRVKLAGRTERMPHTGLADVYLDGAHNAEKLNVAVTAALENHKTGPKIAVLGFLGTKANLQLLKPIKQNFDYVIATQPKVYGKTPHPAEQTASLLSQIGYQPITEPDGLTALKLAMNLAKNGGTVLATGSFYLVGELREHWFSKKQVVLQRSSWPE